MSYHSFILFYSWDADHVALKCHGSLVLRGHWNMCEKKTTYKWPLFTSLFLFKGERYSFFGFTARFSLRQSITIQLKVQFNHLLWALFDLGIKLNQLFRQSIRFTVQHWLLETIQFCIHNQKCSSILNPIQYLKIPPIQFMIQHYTSSHYGLVKKNSNFFPLLLHLTLDKIIFHFSKDWSWTRGPWMVTITAVKLQIYLVS